MHTWVKLFLSVSLLSGAVAHAQTAGTMTFTASKTSAQGSLVPALRWTTTPVASRCVAGGAWSGTKFASGSATLPQITSSKTYTLTCYWYNGTATVSWVPPTANTDNSALTNLTGYKVLYGMSPTSLQYTKSIANPAARSTTVGSLGGATWYFAVRSTTSDQVESSNSALAQKVVGSASAKKSVAITITN